MVQVSVSGSIDSSRQSGAHDPLANIHLLRLSYTNVGLSHTMLLSVSFQCLHFTFTPFPKRGDFGFLVAAAFVAIVIV